MGLQRLSWKALEPQMKNIWFFKVFAVVRFRYFGALDGPLGPILAPLGPIWSQNGSQMGPQMAPNRAKMGHLGDHRAQSKEA